MPVCFFCMTVDSNSTTKPCWVLIAAVVLVANLSRPAEALAEQLSLSIGLFARGRRAFGGRELSNGEQQD